MGYKALVDSNITLAFNLLKDMAVDGTLKKSVDVNFDFGTAELSPDKKAKNLPIKVVVIKDDKNSKVANSIKRQLMFKTRGLGDLNAYDLIDLPDDNDSSVTVEWRFGPMISNNGYTILTEIYREV